MRSKDNNNIHTPNNLSDISISSSRGTNNDNITYDIPEYPFEIVIDKGNPINTYNSRGSLLSLGTILTDESKYYDDNFSLLNNTKTFNISNLNLDNYYSIKSYNGLERMKLDVCGYSIKHSSILCSFPIKSIDVSFIIRHNNGYCLSNMQMEKYLSMSSRYSSLYSREMGTYTLAWWMNNTDSINARVLNNCRHFFNNPGINRNQHYLIELIDLTVKQHLNVIKQLQYPRYIEKYNYFIRHLDSIIDILYPLDLSNKHKFAAELTASWITEKGNESVESTLKYTNYELNLLWLLSRLLKLQSIMENSKYLDFNAKQIISSIDENPWFIYIKHNFINRNESEKIDLRPIIEGIGFNENNIYRFFNWVELHKSMLGEKELQKYNS